MAVESAYIAPNTIRNRPADARVPRATTRASARGIPRAPAHEIGIESHQEHGGQAHQGPPISVPRRRVASTKSVEAKPETALTAMSCPPVIHSPSKVMVAGRRWEASVATSSWISKPRVPA